MTQIKQAQSKKMKISEIRPYKNNAKIHSQEQIEKLKKSIQENGYTQKIGVDKKGVIVYGHGRFAAISELYDQSQSIEVDDLSYLTPAKIKKLRILDNKIISDEWDSENLDAEIMSILGKNKENIESLSRELSLSESDFDRIYSSAFSSPDEKEDELPEEINHITKPGDLWQIGGHYVFCGDSTQEEYLSKIPGSVDLLITDPPYNVDYVGKTQKELNIENDKMTNDNFLAFLSNAFGVAKKAMHPGCSFYIWHAESEGLNFRLAASTADFIVKQVLVWVKNSMVMGRQDYQWKHEPCLYGWVPGAKHNWYGDRKQTTILEFDRPTKSSDDPTMKPVSLFEYQIKNSTKSGDMVLDIFAGSGTTALACQKSNRSSFSVEKDPKYADVAVRRLVEYMASCGVKFPAIKLNGVDFSAEKILK